ncbi:MAG: hypothetical protein QOD06_1636, partial [Candidatus Binatota bacterium]|nr:hypothetical protein [Candidatus Binatota bacterium]
MTSERAKPCAAGTERSNSYLEHLPGGVTIVYSRCLETWKALQSAGGTLTTEVRVSDAVRSRRYRIDINRLSPG